MEKEQKLYGSYKKRVYLIFYITFQMSEGGRPPNFVSRWPCLM